VAYRKNKIILTYSIRMMLLTERDMRSKQKLIYKDFKDIRNGGGDEKGDLPKGVYIGFSGWTDGKGPSKTETIYRMKFDTNKIERIEGKRISGVLEHSVLEIRKADGSKMRGNDVDIALERFEGVWFPEEGRMLLWGIGWDEGSKHMNITIGNENYDLFFESDSIFGNWANREKYNYETLGDDGVFDQPVYLRRIPASLARVSYAKLMDYLGVDTDYFFGTLYHDQNEKEKLKISATINSLSGIEQVSQTFSAKFTIMLEWAPSLQDIYYHVSGKQTGNYEPEWTPSSPVLRNKVEYRAEGEVKSPPELVKLSDNTYKNRLTYTYNVILSENMELEHFPFDVQEFQIQMSYVNDGISKLDFKRKYVTVEKQIEEDFKSSEWEPHIKNYDIDPIEKCKETDTYEFRIILLKHRSFHIYFWRVVFVMGLISLCSLLAIGLDPVEDAADRLGYTVTMVLASIAYSIVIADYLPKLCYLTALDMYVVFTYIFICSWMAAQALLFRFAPDEDYVRKLDHILGMCFFIAWGVFHCGLALCVLHIRKIEKAKLSRKECKGRTNPMSGQVFHSETLPSSESTLTPLLQPVSVGGDVWGGGVEVSEGDGGECWGKGTARGDG